MHERWRPNCERHSYSMPPLDPQRLTPSVSLNRVRLVDLPGLAVDTNVKGKTGFDLVSAVALARLIRQHAGSLQLDPNLNDDALRLALDSCFVSPDATVRAAADAIGRRIGRNLGYILLTLKRGDAVNRAARTEWDDSYWHHWGRIKRVWLGGGLVGGRLGPVARDSALTIIGEANVGDYTLQISPHAPILPLVGAAAYAPPTCKTALVFDFGQTMIKRAWAVYEDGELTELHRLPSHPTGWTEIERASDDPAQQATRFFGRMVSIIAATWHRAGMLPGSPILTSVAAYVQDGHPMLAQGGAYGQLRHITDHLQTELARRVGAHLGVGIDVLLIHDGTAAATTFAGTKNTAVITVGTAMGIGFPPPADGLRTISPNLTIIGPGPEPCPRRLHPTARTRIWPVRPPDGPAKAE